MRAPPLAGLALAVLALPAQALPLPLDLGGLLPAEPVVSCEGACPNLVGDPGFLGWNFVATFSFGEGSCEVREDMAPPGTHSYLNFWTGVPNAGPGDLHVGSPYEHPERFVWSDCHGHWHLRSYVDYRVWAPDDWERYQQLRQLLPQYSSRQLIGLMPDDWQPVSGNKQGFCVIDVWRYPQYGGRPFPTYTSCGDMGVSVGWADVYSAYTPGQWVVIDGLHGPHVLEADTNAGRFYEETGYLDNSVGIPVTLP